MVRTVNADAVVLHRYLLPLAIEAGQARNDGPRWFACIDSLRSVRPTLLPLGSQPGPNLILMSLGAIRGQFRWVIAEQRRKGINFCWAVVQPTGSRFIPIWKRIGFKICPISNGESLALLGDPDADLRHSECR